MSERPFSITSLIRGLALLSAGLAYAAALASHTPADPSFSNSGNVDVQNWLGTTGAHLSDLSLQLLGIAAWLPAALLCFWGLRNLRQMRIHFPWLKIATLSLSLPALATLAALIPAPIDWPISTGMGGLIGYLLTTQSPSEPYLWGVGIAATVISLAGLSFLFQLKLHAILHQPAALTHWFAKHTAFLHRLPRFEFKALAERLTHAAEEDYEEPTAAVKRTPQGITGADDIPTPAPKKKKAAPKKKASKDNTQQESFPLIGGGKVGAFELPHLSFMAPASSRGRHEISQSALQNNAKLLETTLQEFGVKGTIANIRPGPVVTLYELIPAPGTKSSRVIGLADDIARSMSAVSARIAVIPGQNAIGIELPNAKRDTVFLRSLLESKEFRSGSLQLPMALGEDIGGQSVVADLAKMPHLLVAGTTGSGKSVAVNAMILSLLYRHSPETCKFIMIDPKMLELSVYDGIPHLLSPVVTEPGKAVVALKWTVKEMENRYRLMSHLGVRNISGYNKKIAEAVERGEELTRRVQTGFDPETGKPIIEELPLEMEPLPFIVVIVDEMADLMLVAGKDIEGSIQRLAQMARAAGIHIIMATQRPSVDVITGVIKANFPTRISFQVTSRIDSRTILGEQGAEQLLGMGDMLFMSGGSRISRVHGALVTDKEVDAVVTHLKSQGEPNYLADVTTADESDGTGGISFDVGGGSEEDDLFRKAVEVVLRDKKASTSYVQRRLKIGYNRAASLIERMEEEGIISAPNHVGKREILLEGEEA